VRIEVDLDAVPPLVALAEPADCGRFSVAVHGPGGQDALDGALRGAAAGRVAEDGDARVAVDAVRRMAAGSVGPDWEDDFAAMLGYAESKGWMDEGGTEIQAHVEWGTPR